MYIILENLRIQRYEKKFSVFLKQLDASDFNLLMWNYHVYLWNYNVYWDLDLFSFFFY